MKKDYRTVTEVALQDQKKYLLKLCSHGRIEYDLYQCINKRQLNKVINNEQVNKSLYQQALSLLYQCQDFESLEYHLIMMNQFFQYRSYINIKKQLFQKISRKKIRIQEYCVLRHLIKFDHLSFEYFVEELHSHYQVDELECAKICLLEDQYHLAYNYLKQLDNCDDENVFNLLRSYSLCDYLSLKKYYQQKRQGYVLLPTH